jgi:hypothetical protein
MRTIVSASAIRGWVTIAAIASSAAPAAVRRFPGFSLHIAINPLFEFPDGYFLCNVMQRLCQWRQ